MDMVKSAKGHLDSDDDDEEEFVMSKEGSSRQGDLAVKVDGKGTDQKPVTPRSKHSATEQRRRSKINDRFQILKDLIPNTDQKRDKASFLLEVIDYIQFLQEKVQKYEGPCQGWTQERTKLTPWRNFHGPVESFVDNSRGIKNGPGAGLMFPGRFDESNIAVTPTMLANAPNPVESEVGAGAAYKPMDHHHGLENKGNQLPIPVQQNAFNLVASSVSVAQAPQRPASDVENMGSQPQPQLWQNREYVTDYPVTSDALSDHEELMMEGGTINISSAYSQRLLNSLTQALQSSGVDLSQASISVQIDLGKRAINRLSANNSSGKDQDDPPRPASSGEDSDQAQKRLKTEKS